MSYDHVLLPSGFASSIEQVEAYLSTQQGIPEAGTVSDIAAELNKRNEALPEEDSFLSTIPVGGASTGTALYVPCPYDSVGFVRRLLFELATPLDYAVYDPQLAWLIDPSGHIAAKVTHGGAGEFPYLTKALAEQWVPELLPPNPYLIVEREAQFYIQTYRDSSGMYTLEYRDGSPDKHFGTTITDPATVSALIWDWANDNRTHFTDPTWSRVML
ncbi:hypothetical protein ACL02S_16850 [Nocardia sp. 004]|uniref:hypothetical protein n=1 Tax=Nocardia sp. 004 TaxID=3385978 RepID=UPI00399F7A91